MPARLLVLDFDGVVSDSAPECFVVAVGIYAELTPGGPASGWLAEAALPAPAEVLAHPWYAPFLELMPLGNRAEDFGVAIGILEAGLRVPDQASYDAQRAARATDWLERFHARFYERRAVLERRDPAGWHALMRPYAGIPPALRRLAGDWRLAIATSKDRRSVRALLRAYGLEDLFDDARLLDKETGSSKTAHLTQLRAATGVAYADTIFVDDKVNHLDRVATLGVRCALAAWGYNGAREVALARAHGHRVCELTDFEAQLGALAGRPGLGDRGHAP